MVNISEQSQEIYSGLGHVFKIKLDRHGATLYNGLECERLHEQKEGNYLTIAAEVGYLAREVQDRAPSLIGVTRRTLDQLISD